MDALGVLRREDDAIQEEVWRLVRDRLLIADAGLRVTQGVVGMLGRTQRRSDAEAVQNLVAQVPGVVAVHGQIDFVEGDEQPFQTAEATPSNRLTGEQLRPSASGGFGFRK